MGKHTTQDKNKYIEEYTIIKSPAGKITGQDNKNKYAKAGVAITVHNSWYETITEINKYNARHMDVRWGNIIVTCSYAPDMNHEEAEREEYWNALEEKIYKNVDNKILHIWGTDTNGQLGTGKRKQNEKGNGVNLAKLIKKIGMRAMNTIYPQHENEEIQRERLTTWIGTNRKIKRQIDYLMVNNHKVNWVEKAYTSELMNKKTNIGHKMVVLELRTKYKKRDKKKNMYREHITYDIHKMREDYENLKLPW